jgi:hypothetical protein
MLRTILALVCAVSAGAGLLLASPTASAVGGSQHSLLSDSFNSAAVGTCFAEGSSIDVSFVDVFNGYGSQCIGAGPVLDQQPEAPASASDTHAALAVSKAEFSGTYEITATFTTLAQLRSEPNNWEVAWLLWDYSGANSFYDVVLKPQGWEVDKEWCDSSLTSCQSQQFLATGTSPSFPVGSSVTVTVDQQVNAGVPHFRIYTAVGNTAAALLTTVADPGAVSAPYLSGKVGLYTEEAAVAWKSITVKS